MAINYLTAMPSDPFGQATFAFEHAMAHRTYLGALAPLDRFSVIPYFVDPQQLTNDKWKLNHQQAHLDFMFHLPNWFDWATRGGIQLPHNLLDYDLDDPDQRTWWIFANNQEHWVAMHSLPLQLLFPFW